MQHRARQRLAAALVLGSGLLLAGCADDGGSDEQAEFEAASAPATSTTADGGDDGADDPDVIGVDHPDPDEVIAEAVLPVPSGAPGREVRVGIAGIVVTEETMELRLVVTPLFDDGGRPASVFEAMENGVGVIPTRLIDREHLKEYRVLRDGSHRFETDPVFAKPAEAGGSVGFQQFFAPPEDDIEVIDVQINDGWPVFEDVPLTYEG